MPNAPEPTAEVCTALDELGISYTLHHHPAVFSCVESARLVRGVPGVPSKSLLLKSTDGKFFLVITPCAKRLNPRQLAAALGCGRLSFARPSEIATLLRLQPGSVSPFGVMHDAAGRVQVVLDDAVLAQTVCHFHPNDNRATVALGTDDFKKFLNWASHPPQIINIP